MNFVRVVCKPPLAQNSLFENPISINPISIQQCRMIKDDRPEIPAGKTFGKKSSNFPLLKSLLKKFYPFADANFLGDLYAKH